MTATSGVSAAQPIVRGAGDPVLLITGGAASIVGFFADVEDRLAEHFSVILYERQACGRRSDEPVPSPTQQTAELAAVIRKVSDRPAIVVAQSLGGPVALQLALDAPDVVRALVLLDPTPANDLTVCRQAGKVFSWAERPGMSAIFRAMTRSTMRKQVPPGSPAIERARADMLTLEPRPTTAMLLKWIDEFPRLCSRLRDRGNVHGVLVTADRRPSSRVRRAHEELAAVSGLELECWPGTSHVMHLQATDRIVDLVMCLAES